MVSPVISGDTPARSTPRLIAPFALVMLGAFALCAGVGYVVARDSDARHQDQRRASLLGVIDEYRIVFAELTRRSAARIAVGPLRGPELARSLEPVGLARYVHENACLVGPDGELIAAVPAAERVSPAVARVLADFRAANAGGDTDEHAPGSVATEAIMLNGRAALVAVAAVPSSGRDRGMVLARVKRLDAGLVDTFQKMSGVSGLAFDAEAPHADRDVQALLDAQGRMVGWLSWTREHPAMDAVVRLLPLIAGVAAGLIGFAALAIRQIGRATRRLATSEAEAYRIAYDDPITGLPNRRKMRAVIDAALAGRPSERGISFGLIDVDNFADLKETLGEQGSDALLRATGERLRVAVPRAITLGRVGPSEFSMVVVDDDGSGALAAAHAAVKEMTRPLWVANQSVSANITVGLVHAPGDGETREELVRRADLARRSVGHRSVARIACFDPGMEQEFQDRLFIKRELRRTLAEGGFSVHYQPIVAAEGQRVVGVEALARWNHPTRGMIPPVEFIPIAEQIGLMSQLGEFVLRRALSDATYWKDVYVAVNISPYQMRDRGLVNLVAAAIGHTGIAPSRVMLEITEGVLIDNPDEANERLQQLRKLGVKIALDDFGSGYSSLSYLRKFPIDKLKIDKEFVAPLGRSSDGGVIIQAIIALGRALGLSVLCEGVETEEQRILLRLAGCDEMQGFLFAKPAPRAAIERMILGQSGEGARKPAIA